PTHPISGHILAGIIANTHKATRRHGHTPGIAHLPRTHPRSRHPVVPAPNPAAPPRKHATGIMRSSLHACPWGLENPEPRGLRRVGGRPAWRNHGGFRNPDHDHSDIVIVVLRADALNEQVTKVVELVVDELGSMLTQLRHTLVQTVAGGFDKPVG